MFLWNKRTENAFALLAASDMWNNHLHLYVFVKSKVTQNIFNIQERYQNTQNCKSWYRQKFVHYKTLLIKKKRKTCLGQSHLVSGRFVKVCYKTTTYPRWPFFSCPKSICLIQVWLYFFRVELGNWIKFPRKVARNNFINFQSYFVFSFVIKITEKCFKLNFWRKRNFSEK